MSPRAAYSSVDVSIVVTNQDQGPFMERCLRSCLAQTFPGRFHEVIVVDAASRDFSREVIHAYGRQIVPILLDDPQAMLEAAVAAGMKRARGRYVLHVRAQDFLSDYMILFQAIWLYQNVQHHGVSVDYWLMDEGSEAKLTRVSGLEHPYGTMYRKEIWVKEGLYEVPPQGRIVDALHQRLAMTYTIGHLPIPFYRFQQERQQVVGSRDREVVG